MIQRNDVEEMVNGLQWDTIYVEMQPNLEVQAAAYRLIMSNEDWEELNQKLSEVFE